MSIIADIEAELSGKGPGATSKVHIRNQQRNTRKSITTVEGLEPDLDLKKILKAMKKKFNCNGAVLKTKDGDKVLKFSGDQRENIKNFLVEFNIVEKGDIITHGF